MAFIRDDFLILGRTRIVGQNEGKKPGKPINQGKVVITRAKRQHATTTSTPSLTLFPNRLVNFISLACMRRCARRLRGDTRATFSRSRRVYLCPYATSMLDPPTIETRMLCWTKNREKFSNRAWNNSAWWWRKEATPPQRPLTATPVQILANRRIEAIGQDGRLRASPSCISIT